MRARHHVCLLQNRLEADRSAFLETVIGAFLSTGRMVAASLGRGVVVVEGRCFVLNSQVDIDPRSWIVAPSTQRLVGIWPGAESRLGVV
jgi:hypothetical protein